MSAFVFKPPREYLIGIMVTDEELDACQCGPEDLIRAKIRRTWEDHVGELPKIAPGEVYFLTDSHGNVLPGGWAFTTLEYEQEEIDITSFGMTNTSMVRGAVNLHGEVSWVGDADTPARVMQRARDNALAEAPPDVKEVLEAIYELEAGLPPEKELFVEYDPDNGKRFTAQVRDRADTE